MKDNEELTDLEIDSAEGTPRREEMVKSRANGEWCSRKVKH